jgi:hypothetical protein
MALSREVPRQPRLQCARIIVDAQRDTHEFSVELSCRVTPCVKDEAISDDQNEAGLIPSELSGVR